MNARNSRKFVITVPRRPTPSLDHYPYEKFLSLRLSWEANTKTRNEKLKVLSRRVSSVLQNLINRKDAFLEAGREFKTQKYLIIKKIFNAFKRREKVFSRVDANIKNKIKLKCQNINHKKARKRKKKNQGNFENISSENSRKFLKVSKKFREQKKVKPKE